MRRPQKITSISRDEKQYFAVTFEVQNNGENDLGNKKINTDKTLSLKKQLQKCEKNIENKQKCQQQKISKNMQKKCW